MLFAGPHCNMDHGGEKSIEVYGRVPGNDTWNRGPNIPRDTFSGAESYVDNVITVERAAELGFTLSDFEGTEARVLTAEEIEEAKKQADEINRAKSEVGKLINSKPKAGSGRKWNIAVILGAAMGVFLALQ